MVAFLVFNTIEERGSIPVHATKGNQKWLPFLFLIQLRRGVRLGYFFIQCLEFVVLGLFFLLRMISPFSTSRECSASLPILMPCLTSFSCSMKCNFSVPNRGNFCLISSTNSRIIACSMACCSLRQLAS